MPILKPSTTLTILSDLHLSGGLYLASGELDPLEQFHADQAFDHFVEYLVGNLGGENQPGRLLFLGDLLDFLHTRAESPAQKHERDAGSSEATALRKLDKIFAGHTVFFAAVRRLVAAGFQIDLVPGNHDIDLMRPAVRAQFTDYLAKTSQQADSRANIHFFPWLYTIPGLLYAEHGNQYHDLNSFSTLLSPYHHRHPDELELPLGSYFDMLINHLVEMAGTSGQENQQPVRSLPRQRITRPMRQLRAIPDVFSFAWNALRTLAYRGSPACTARRRAYQSSILPEYASGLNLEVKTVVSLDKLCAGPDARMLARLFRKVFLPGKQTVHGGYLFQAARSIHNVLQSDGTPVPFYVFGHSHQAIKLPLPGDTNGGSYFLNTGTWSEAQYSHKARAYNTFPFIQIVNEPGVQGPTARLFQWNENLKQPEQLS